MHDFARACLSDACEAGLVPVHLVVAKACRAALWLLGHRRRCKNWVVDIGRVQNLALLFVEREEGIVQDALANLAHKLVVEIDVVLP